MPNNSQEITGAVRDIEENSNVRGKVFNIGQLLLHFRTEQLLEKLISG